jgi:hypothetical protein
VASQDVSDFI